MAGPSQQEDHRADEASVLAVLDVVGKGEALNQRRLASRVGVALGLANALLRRCVGKGLIKVRQAPARRYVYYLTPNGFAEKSRLVAEYLSSSLGFFRQARAEYADLFAARRAEGWRRVALVGAGELAEIAILSAEEEEIVLIGIVDAGRNTERFHGLPVFRKLADLPPCDGVVLCASRYPQEAFDELRRVLPAGHIAAPPLLSISTHPPTELE